MILRLQIKYVPRKLIYTPDTLSRTYQTVLDDTDLEFQEETGSSTKLDQFIKENENDPQMQAIHP